MGPMNLLPQGFVFNGPQIPFPMPPPLLPHDVQSQNLFLQQTWEHSQEPEPEQIPEDPAQGHLPAPRLLSPGIQKEDQQQHNMFQQPVCQQQQHEQQLPQEPARQLPVLETDKSIQHTAGEKCWDFFCEPQQKRMLPTTSEAFLQPVHPTNLQQKAGGQQMVIDCQDQENRSQHLKQSNQQQM